MYRILKKHDRIPAHSKRPKQPMERPAPMIAWQIDCKDEGLVRADATDLVGKRHHVVEPLTIIDVGTSLLLDAHVRSDFTAQTALEALATFPGQVWLPPLA
jgi:hypothetical protein